MSSYRSLEDAILRGWGNERAFICPAHDDHNASASVNVAKGVWYCYTCHAKGKVGVLAEMDDQDFGQMVADLLDEEPVRVYPESFLDTYDLYGPGEYWLSRMTEETARYYRFGFDPLSGAPTYPFRNLDGELNGVVVRRVPRIGDPPGPKYKYPPGTRKSNALFGFTNEFRRHILLVEGAPDVAACRDADVEAFGTYSANLHQEQVNALKRIGVEDVTIAYDQDEAGKSGMKQASHLLVANGFPPPRLLLWDKDWGDLSDMPLGRRLAVLKMARA